MMKIVVLINTYERATMLDRLLQDIYDSRSSHDLKLFVSDDHCTVKYVHSLAAKYHKLDITLFVSQTNHGKQMYWALVNRSFAELRGIDFDFIVMMPDDVRLESDYFNKALDHWAAIPDQRKICLSTLLSPAEMGKSKWASGVPALETCDGFDVYKTMWTDLAFFAPRSILETLNFKVLPIPKSRWQNKPRLSSGVGEQITKRLRKAGCTLYHTANTLMHHGGHESKMNYEERKRNPLIS